MGKERVVAIRRVVLGVVDGEVVATGQTFCESIN
jgi:hypothetical protein